MVKSRLAEAVGLVVVVSSVAVALMAQTPAGLAFEVASVKASAPDGTGFTISGPRPGSFLAENAPLADLIMYAFTMREEQLAALPGWARTERFDVIGKYPAGLTPSPSDVRLMTRSLLVERFKLQTHVETREGPIYALVLARGDRRLGPRLKPMTIDCTSYLAEKRATGERLTFMGAGDAPPCSGLTSDLFIKVSGRPMANLALSLSDQVGRPVIDRTGLVGNFDYNLEWTLGTTAAAAAPSNDGPVSPSDDGVSLFSALQEQLGLKLESARGPVDVLVIDHVERPTED